MVPKYKCGMVFLSQDACGGLVRTTIDQIYKRENGEFLYKMVGSVSLVREEDVSRMEQLREVSR